MGCCLFRGGFARGGFAVRRTRVPRASPRVSARQRLCCEPRRAAHSPEYGRRFKRLCRSGEISDRKQIKSQRSGIDSAHDGFLRNGADRSERRLLESLADAFLPDIGIADVADERRIKQLKAAEQAGLKRVRGAQGARKGIMDTRSPQAGCLLALPQRSVQAVQAQTEVACHALERFLHASKTGCTAPRPLGKVGAQAAQTAAEFRAERLDTRLRLRGIRRDAN